LRCFIDHLPLVGESRRGSWDRACPMPDRESVRFTGMVEHAIIMVGMMTGTAGATGRVRLLRQMDDDSCLHRWMQTVIIDGRECHGSAAIGTSCTVIIIMREGTWARFDERKAWMDGMGWAKDGWLASSLLSSSNQSRPDQRTLGLRVLWG
jgi:hypothetical protein